MTSISRIRYHEEVDYGNTEMSLVESGNLSCVIYFARNVSFHLKNRLVYVQIGKKRKIIVGIVTEKWCESYESTNTTTNTITNIIIREK